MGSESRLHPRLLLDARADVIGDEVILGRSLGDISMGGCRFEGAAWEDEGVDVEIVLSFPGIGANVPVRGTVVRASDKDMGVRFTDLSDEQKWALRKHIREAQAAAAKGTPKNGA